MKTITKGARVSLIATSIMLALDGPAYAATLAVAANQPDGVYSGNFDIAVTYF